ncbi:doubled CXXCH domain protein, partial [Vibrio parahaemolyticus EKP-021]
TGCCCWLGRV